MKKRKVGRPKLPKGQVKNIIAIRVTDSERKDYEEGASKQGVTLSNWIRRRTNLSDRTIKELRKKLLELRDGSTAGSGVKRIKGSDVYMLADDAIMTLDRLSMDLAIESGKFGSK